MSQFVQDLWESVFTPGPTPSLLIATNATFAVLQVVLFVLLLATYSIHFIILSFLSAGLWWAINWFAQELKAVREEQEEEQRKQRRRAAVAAATSAQGSTDSETEVEEQAPGRRQQATGRRSGAEPVDRHAGEVRQRTAAGAAARAGADSVVGDAAPAAAAPTLGLEKTIVSTDASSSQDSKGSQTNLASSLHLSGGRSGVSTEDEWEKVSENEQ